jgi:hypothetical protein
MSLLRATSFIKFVPQLISCNRHHTEKRRNLNSQLTNSISLQQHAPKRTAIFHKARHPAAQSRIGFSNEEWPRHFQQKSDAEKEVPNRSTKEGISNTSKPQQRTSQPTDQQS